MARNKRDGGGSNAGVDTKRNYPNRGNQQNGNYYCVNHGHNSSHATADCNQAQYQNQNSNNKNNNQKKDKKKNEKGNQTVVCASCKKVGHFASDCWGNSSNHPNNDQSDPPPAYSRKDTSQANKNYSNQKPIKHWEQEVPLENTSHSLAEAVGNYCKHCNELGHNPTVCENIMGMYAALRSKLYCNGCRFRGHLLDDCKNPISKECAKCGQKGHKFNECGKNPSTMKLESYFRMEASKGKGKRFLWDGEQIALHESQQVENEYRIAMEHAKLNGIPLSEDEHAWHQQRIMHHRQVFDTNVIIENAKKLAGVVDYNTNLPGYLNRPPIKTNTTPPARPNAATYAPYAAMSRPNIATRSSTNATNPDPAALRQALMAKFRAIRPTAAEMQAFETFYDKSVSEQKSELELAIAAKIKSSLTLYTLKKVNHDLLTGEALILTKAKLPNFKMDEVKFAMLMGASIYRDNRAMQMLFERKVPQCTICKRNGTIFDRWFNPVPIAATKRELLAVDDYNDWGIFVGMECKCASSTDEFEYVPCSIVDLESLAEDEI